MSQSDPARPGSWDRNKRLPKRYCHVMLPLHCHFMGEVTWVVNRVVYAAVGGALRTILKDILAKIDAEIARLELVKASLSEPGAAVANQ